MKIRKITEEFVGYASKDAKKIVYKNPSYKEMLSLGSIVRFAALLETKEVFVSNAHYTVHTDIQDVFDRKDERRLDMFNENKSLTGICKKEGRVWKVSTLSYSSIPFEDYIKDTKKYIEENYNWINKYRIEFP